MAGDGVLVDCQTVQEVAIRGQRIGPEGARRIAEALADNRSLQVLHLQGNNIGKQGAEYLAQALKTNQSLEELYLEGNDVLAAGGESLATALMYNSSMLKLDFGADYVAPENGVEMRMWLDRNKEAARSKVVLNLELQGHRAVCYKMSGEEVSALEGAALQETSVQVWCSDIARSLNLSVSCAKFVNSRTSNTIRPDEWAQTVLQVLQG